MNYQQVSFATGSTEQQEMLIALLEHIGFEGFEEQPNGLSASIPEVNYERPEVEQIAAKLGLSFTEETVLPQNWNAIWEAGFEPVVVEGFCTIRASFHQVNTATPYEIIITPKMSFGTGHHATTQLMLEAMRELDFSGRSVLDFGTGTGILAILAKMMGAENVTAIDHDEWSVTNAAENAAINNCSIMLAKASLEDIAAAQYDLVLANINRNILLEHMEAMSQQLVANGTLVLSGILPEDEPVVTAAAVKAGLVRLHAASKNGWTAVRFQKR